MIWTLWIVLVAASFLFFELRAVHKGGLTLSEYVVRASRIWKLLPFVLGTAVGAVAGHFWWPYCG